MKHYIPDLNRIIFFKETNVSFFLQALGSQLTVMVLAIQWCVGKNKIERKK